MVVVGGGGVSDGGGGSGDVMVWMGAFKYATNSNTKFQYHHTKC